MALQTTEISQVQIGGDKEYNLADTAVRQRVTSLESLVSSAMIIKGTASTATDITGLTDYKVGWCYKATASFTITGLGNIENGDMIVCIADYNSTYSAQDWTVVQNNVDDFIGASSSAAGARGLVPSPSQGYQDAVLKGNGYWIIPFVSSGRLSVAATADGANGYIPVYQDTNGNYCVPITGWKTISSLIPSGN